MDVYVAILRSPQGELRKAAFKAISYSQVLYAVTEFYPDWPVVRIYRDVDWETDRDGAVATSRE